MRQKLALLATCAAALSSIATSQIEPSWELEATTAGPALSLTTSGSIAHTVAGTMNSAGMANETPSARVEIDASACLEGSASGPVRLFLYVLDTAGDGQVSSQEVPACPASASFAAAARTELDCSLGVECTRAVNVTFTRDGADGGNVTVQWNATAFVGGYGNDDPPEGAQASIAVE